MKIAFIGAGKMAEALISRLGSPRNITASDIDKRRLSYLRAKYKIKIARNNREAFRAGKVVVLAVKPQQMAEVLKELGDGDRTTRVIISIAAGIPLKYLEKKLPGASIIRAMPNNPCLVGAGMTALAKGKRASSKQYAAVDKIFKSVGEVIRVPEKWMDAVTGLSGSGPAFVYLMLDALIEGGKAEGLPFPVAEKLALQTVLGAAETARRTVHSLKKLREMVASPGGTTVEGLAVLKKYKMEKSLSVAVRAAAKKAKILSERWAT